jgi:AraC-like DNA-binding protein
MASEPTAVVESVLHDPGDLALAVPRWTGYRMSGFSAGRHAGLPSPTLTLIVSFDDPLTLSQLPDPAAAPARHWTMIGGLHTRPATIEHDGNQHGIQLDVSPLGARMLLGRPAADLAEQVVALDEVLGPLAIELHERLSASDSWSSRFAVLQELLRRRVARLDAPVVPRSELRWAWNQLCAGATGVEALADELGWSRRHLSAQFRDEFGISPRTMMRIVRFDHARRLLGTGGPQRLQLAEVAHRSGYADQSHLSREWVRLAGASPTAWRSEEEFPSVHDDVPLPVAG